jgi:hypothetical protein
MCVEIQKGLIAPNEFARKIDMVLKEDPDHAEDLIDALSKTNSEYLDQLDKYLNEKLIKELADILIIK